MLIGTRKVKNARYLQEALDRTGFKTMQEYLINRCNKMMPYGKMARELDVVEGTVILYVKAAGLYKKRSLGGPRNVRWDVSNKEVQRLDSLGYNRQEIAEKFNCSIPLVSEALHGRRLATEGGP